MSRLLRLLLVALALGPASAPALGQVVRGRVLEGGSNAPVEGAMVVLLELEGRVVRRVLTDASGGFITDADHPGAYVIRVDRIGYESLTTERFDVPVDGTFRTVVVPIKPVELEGLEVGGSRRCALRNEQGETTARVWEEARKALEAAAWTLSSGTYRYTLLNYERKLGRDLNLVSEDRRFSRGTGQAPYVSYPASQLVGEGFVIRNPDRSLSYLAPDAAAFLSDEFLDTHCMALESVRDGLIGLAYEPVRGRRLPDIRGTLWIEAATATLRKLDFSYVNLPAGPDEGNPGGEVVFGRLPNGTWIVREWSIRMPQVTTNPERTRVSITGHHVQGGVVWRVIDRTGRTVVEAETASLSGTVLDSLEAGPVAGARIRSTDGAGEAVTGAAGSFFLPGLPAGLASVEVSHPSLDTLGLGPVPARTEAAAGEVTSIRVRLPGVEEILAGACSGTPAVDRETATVLARVRWGAFPAARARVRLRWLGTEREGFESTSRAAPPLPDAPDLEWREDPEDARFVETTLDHRGIFLVCGVPTGSQIRVEVGEGDRADVRTVTVPSGTRTLFVPVNLEEPRAP